MVESVIAIGAVSIFGILYVGLVLLSMSVSREQKALIAKLAKSHCPECGTKYGLEAATRAPQTHVARCEEVRRQKPGYRINFVREWPIECPNCKHESYFDYQEQQLHALDFRARCEQRIKREQRGHSI